MPPHAPTDDQVVAHVARPAPTPVPVPAKEFLTSRDNLFLTVEDDKHSMNVSGLYYFPQSMDADEMRSHIAAFAASFPRCRQKMVWPNSLFARPYWAADPTYDIDNHFTRVQLPAPGNDEVLMDIAGPLHAKRLDTSRPLWHCYWFDGLDGGDRKVILFVAHHAIADGQGFVRNLLSFVAAQDPTIEDVRSLQYAAGRHSAAPSPAPSENGDSISTTSTAMTVYTRAADAAAVVQQQATGVAVFFLAVLTYLYHMLLLVLIPRRSFTATTETATKQTAWTTAHVPLDAVKAIKNRYKVTVNDVLTACVGAALGSHLPEDLQDPRFWLLIPTSMRRPDDISASNRSSGYVLPIANGPHLDISQRIRAVNATMRSAKASPEAVVNYSFAGLFYKLPNAFPSMFLAASKLLHGVLTNVPGPNASIRWGAHEITSMVAFIPQASPNSVSSAVYTYNGKVTLSVHMSLIPGHQVFGEGAAKAIVASFEKALQAASLHAEALAIEQGQSDVETKKLK
ncbi:hypothetical protein HDU86_000682 [Geranomyces michiganensis]|nr:hypothetical protein HDU86_000682 [Geranomyces michiganensis]